MFRHVPACGAANPYGSMTAVAMDGPNLITSQDYFQGNASNPAILQTWDADSLLSGNKRLQRRLRPDSRDSFYSR